MCRAPVVDMQGFMQKGACQMRLNGWFDGINVWKINTLGDLIFYVLLILLGALIFFLVIRRINHNRRPDVAMKRVARRLKRLGGKGSRV